jgi:CHAT domain-containing protein
MKAAPIRFLLALFFVAAYGAARGQASQYESPMGSSQPTPHELDVTAFTREAIRKGEVKEALSSLETKALDAEKNGNWDEANLFYLNAASAAGVSGQLQKALSYGSKAFEMGEKARDPRLQAMATVQLLNAHRRLGQYAKAREWLERGIEIVEKVPTGYSKIALHALMYRELGTESLRSGESQKAIDYISYALQVVDSELETRKRNAGRDPPGVVQSWANQVVGTISPLGNAYQSVGKFEEAIKVYEKGLDTIKQTRLKTSQEGNFYRGLGQAYLGRKDFGRARENLNKALEIAERAQDTSGIQQASGQMGNLLRQTQKSSEAIPYYKKAVDSIESIRSLLQSEEFRSSFFDDKRETYSGMILAYLENKHTAEAFSYSERARSRAFLDILGSKVQLAHGSLLEEERALQAKISALQAMMAGQESRASDRPEVRKDLEAAQKSYNDFLAKVRKENKEQASLMNVEPLTLKQVQELLEPGVTVLEYFVTQQAVLLWVVEKERAEFVNIALSRRDLLSKVGSLRESVFQLGEKEKFRASSQELYKLLIEPGLPHIRGKELLIIPHDVLHYLPFQALLSSQGKYLIQDYPIYYLSSASLMQFTKEKKRAGGEQALVMGNPSLGDQAYNLRFAEREAKEIARVYPTSAVYIEAEATKPRAISLSPKYDMLHFAVHAELNEQDPMISALLLAPEGKDDGRLNVGEIFSLNLKAGMVVLSACETGLGKLSNGDEMVGLTRAFIYAGTPSIVTTLWKVNDRASYELMKEFYQHLKDGKKSEALRQAQLKTMEEFPEPFYWAAYELTGEP